MCVHVCALLPVCDYVLTGMGGTWGNWIKGSSSQSTLHQDHDSFFRLGLFGWLQGEVLEMPLTGINALPGGGKWLKGPGYLKKYPRRLGVVF